MKPPKWTLGKPLFLATAKGVFPFIPVSGDFREDYRAYVDTAGFFHDESECFPTWKTAEAEHERLKKIPPPPLTDPNSK